MRKALLLMCILILATSVARGAEPFAEEVKAFRERICSGDASIRYEAVREAQATRQAIAEALIAVVNDANAGVLNHKAKASAIYVAGELMLVQCEDMIEREKDWFFKWNDDMVAGSYMMRMGSMTGYVARCAQRKLTLSSGVRVTRTAIPSDDLAAWPALSEAIADIRAGETKTVNEGITTLTRWYGAMRERLSSSLDNYGKGNLSTEAAITCAFLLGEFRAYDPSPLRRQIEIEDAKGLCRTYPATLAVDTVDDLHPCMVALIKCGNRVQMRGSVNFLTMERPSQKARDLVADAMVLIDPAEARAHYERLVSELTGDTRSAYTDADGCLARLRSVEGKLLWQ